MKRIFKTVAASMFFLMGAGQNLEFIDTTTYVSGSIDPPDGYIQAAWLVKNTDTLDTARVLVYREILQEVSGSDNYFCWGPICYPASVDTATAVAKIPPGEIDTTFFADYRPKGNEGITKIRYCFYDTSDISNTACVTVTFEATEVTGISRDAEMKTDIRVYPNPAKNNVIVKARGSKGRLQFELYDILGSRLMTQPIRSDIYETVDVSGLTPGLYIYKVTDQEFKVVQSNLLIITK